MFLCFMSSAKEEFREFKIKNFLRIQLRIQICCEDNLNLCHHVNID